MGHRHLSLEKREIIERMLRLKTTIRQIARFLGYSPSAISQEITRNSKYIDGRLTYRAEVAHNRAAHKRRRRMGITGKTQQLIDYIIEKLKLYWSPEQIVGRLKLDFPDQPKMRVSFKTIYRWIQRSRNHRSPLGFKILYTKYLRLKRAGKRMRPSGPERRGALRDLPSIDDRVEKELLKKDVGHWEGDLVNGYKNSGYIATFVEMSTGFLVATYCKNKRPDDVSNEIIKLFQRMNKDNIKTITLDRGPEFRAYPALEKELGCKTYFCHPQCPNERALNEQTNGLLRQFFPKRKPIDPTDTAKLARAVRLINSRPRKKFGYRTTLEIMKSRGIAHAFSLV